MRIITLIFMLLSFISFGQKGNSLIRSGNKDYENKKYKDAEINYRSSLNKDPQSYEGNYNLGNALYRQGKYDDASKQFLQSSGLSKNPVDLSRSYYNLGNTLMNSEKYQESVEAYKMALRQNPKDDDARYNLSYAISKLKKQQEQKDKKQDKQDKKQDKKDQQQQKQDQQKQEQQKQEQEQKTKAKQQPKISKEDAERMLQALKNEEKNLQKKNAKKFEAKGGTPEKDW